MEADPQLWLSHMTTGHSRSVTWPWGKKQLDLDTVVKLLCLGAKGLLYSLLMMDLWRPNPTGRQRAPVLPPTRGFLVVGGIGMEPFAAQPGITSLMSHFALFLHNLESNKTYSAGLNFLRTKANT